MQALFNLVTETGEGRVVEKKSEFLAVCCRVRSEEEALAVIEAERKRYYDARHHCYAYLTGNGQVKKFSDDGEPSQTAGRPMMDVIEGRNLMDVCIVVTRYFGGTLLGTGGLVRAYQGAARDAADHAVVCPVYKGVLLAYEVSYDLYGRLQRMADGERIFLRETEFGQTVKAVLLTEEEAAGSVVRDLENWSAGKAKLLDKTETEYMILNGKAILREELI